VDKVEPLVRGASRLVRLARGVIDAKSGHAAFPKDGMLMLKNW
jgi:hypothetical protein